MAAILSQHTRLAAVALALMDLKCMLLGEGRGARLKKLGVCSK
jgi:hypothetical protein